MERKILHIDCNKFYASVECLLHPELKDKPVAVGGSVKDRHGIILTKNEAAAKYNLTVGEPIWKAKQKCPDLTVIEPNFPLYVEYSKKVRKIFDEYTDLTEPFGLDECWLDVTGDWKRSAEEIGFEIKERIKKEVGITVSVGLSFNKIFAKLGSDYKKPDAMTVIRRENYKDIVWPLPCSDMIMVGKSTAKKLNYYGIYTLGALANCDEKFIKNILGKNGITLRKYARGEDMSPVMPGDYRREIKSVGNSVTAPRDLVNEKDVHILFTSLSQSVARRMRKDNLKGTTLCISVRDTNLNRFTRQCRLSAPTNVSTELAQKATELFKINYNWKNPVRSLGLSVTDFDFSDAVQYDFSNTAKLRERREKLEFAVDSIKDRYGDNIIHTATELTDLRLKPSFCPFQSQ